MLLLRIFRQEQSEALSAHKVRYRDNLTLFFISVFDTDP